MVTARERDSLNQILRASSQSKSCQAEWIFLNTDLAIQESLSARDLARRANCLASVIAALSPRGTPALLVYDEGPDFLVAFFACLECGLIPIPIAPWRRRTAQSAKVICSNSGSRLALTSQLLSDPVRETLKELNVSVMATDSIDSKEQSFYSSVSGGFDIAYVQYTSGSTSAPRGVAISHTNVIANLRAIDEAFQHTPGSVIVSWLPHFHDMGLVYGLLQPLYSGCRCYLMSPQQFAQRPMRWLRAISRFKGTHSGAPNFAYETCFHRISSEECVDLDLRSWDVAFNGSERVRSETMRRFSEKFGAYGFRNSSFAPSYGLAEATLKVTSSRRGRGPQHLTVSRKAMELGQLSTSTDPNDSYVVVSSGSVGEGTEVIIVDPDSRVCLRNEQIGEIWVRGYAVARGYWRQTRATRDVFEAELEDRPGQKYLRTGDLGFLANGQLFVTGRIKEIIIIRGRNYYPEDIEGSARKTHPALGGCLGAAFAVESAAGHEGLCVIHEVRMHTGLILDDVIRAIRSDIARDHEIRPDAVVLVRAGTLPRTSSGKVKRIECRERWLSKTMAVVASDAIGESRSACATTFRRAEWQDTDLDRAGETIKKLLVELVSEVIGLEIRAVDPEVPLVAQGIDSLGAAQLSMRICSELGIEVAVSEILSEVSVSQLVVQLTERPTQKLMSHPREAPRPDELRPSREQERFWRLSQANPNRSAYNLCASFPLTGRVRIERLELAVNNAFERHEPLRTRFADENGHLRIEVDPKPIATIERLDLRGLPDTDKSAALARKILEIAESPFHLNVGPLCRVALIQIAEDEFRLVLAAHHAAADGLSILLLAREICGRYESSSMGSDDTAGSSPSYRDYAQGQIVQKQDALGQLDLNFWREELGKSVASLQLPGSTDLASNSFTIEHLRIELTSTQTQMLNQFARALPTTRFAVLLAAYAVFLFNLSGQTEIAIGIPAARRHGLERNNLIGPFALPLPVRIDLAGNPSMAELTRRVASSLGSVLDHQDTPADRISELVRAAQKNGRGGWVQAMLGYLRDDSGTQRFGDITLGSVELHVQPSDVDLFVTLVESRASIRGLFSYRSDRFSAQTVGSWLNIFRAVLQELLENPNKPVRDLTPLSGVEQAQSDFQKAEGRLVIAATFSADQVAEALEFWMKELKLGLRVRLGPYNQPFQTLLDPLGCFASSRPGGMNILLLKLDDWLNSDSSSNLSDGQQMSRGSALVTEFQDALASAVHAGRGPDILMFCPGPPREDPNPSLAGWILKSEQTLTASASVLGVSVLGSTEASSACSVESFYDHETERLAHLPYTREYCAALATTIARRIYSIKVGPRKVLVIDCDETIWRGFCGESGPQDVSIDACCERLQHFVVAQQRDGMLICLCSKNEEMRVLDAFSAHPEMPLQLEHVVSWRINWERKSANLRSMAHELGFELASFIFIDDDPFECAEVKTNCPDVLVLQWPQDDSGFELLAHTWSFDRLQVTEEDRIRTAQYRQNAARKQMELKSVGLRDFLAGLNTTAELQPMRIEHVDRASQLTLRVTQFNTSNIKRSQQEFHALLASPVHRCFILWVQDRFGDYGTSGLIVVSVTSRFHVESMVMTCRVLGKGVERQMLFQLAGIAGDAGFTEIELEWKPTQRNTRLRLMLEQITGVSCATATVCRIDVGKLRRLEIMDWNETEFVEVPSQLAHRIEAGVDPATLVKIATDLTSAEAVVRQLRRSRESAIARPFAIPRTGIERALAAIWRDLLKHQQVGLDDNFFDLGGDSLLAMQVVSRVHSLYGIDLPVEVFFASSATLEAVAQSLEGMLMSSLDFDRMKFVLRAMEQTE